MAFFETLNKIEKKYAWSFLGVLLAIFFGVLSFYLGFIREEKPDLNFRILSNARVFEIREQLKDISLLYDGIDILEENKSLSIIVFKVINDGNESILSNYYAPTSPLGFMVTNGTLLNVELVEASDTYISNNLNMKSDSLKASFSSLIIDPQESFTIKTLVLHPSDSIPSLLPIGKIAKHDNINVIEIDKEVEESFFNQVWRGSIWMHIARFFLYFLLMTLASFTIVLLIILPSEKISERKRMKLLKRFRKRESVIEDNLENIFDYYVKNGSGQLLLIDILISDQNTLNKLYEIYSLKGRLESTRKEIEILDSINDYKEEGPMRISRIDLTNSTIKTMLKLDLIDELEDSFEINEVVYNDYKEFIKYLKLLEN